MWSRKKSQTLTREDQISQNNGFPLLGITNLREVGVQDEEDHTSQEGQDTYSNSKVAGSIIGIEHALEILMGSYVHVAFRCNGCKHHDGEHLRRTEKQVESCKKAQWKLTAATWLWIKWLWITWLRNESEKNSIKSFLSVISVITYFWRSGWHSGCRKKIIVNQLPGPKFAQNRGKKNVLMKKS